MEEVKNKEKKIVVRVAVTEVLSTDDDSWIRKYMVSAIKDAMTPHPRFPFPHDKAKKLDIHPVFKTIYIEDIEYLEASITYVSIDEGD